MYQSGISTFVYKPYATSDYLDPLLEFAAKHIPSRKHAETPLYILATAGMRLLTHAEQEAILDVLRVDIPLKYQFHFTSTHAAVISGKQEGKIYRVLKKRYFFLGDMIR